MKLTDKYTPLQMERSVWDVYEHCDVVLGHVLDDNFEESHIHVYEHERHTIGEMFFQPESSSSSEFDSELYTKFASEERDVLAALQIKGNHRLLRIVGDVGVGKTTFLKHLMDKHFPNADFSNAKPIYFDWRGFTASAKDPLPAIYSHFATTVFSTFERVSKDELVKLDKELFQTANMFAVDRGALLHIPRSQHGRHVSNALCFAMREHPVDFAIERINKICTSNRNALVLVFDNIDQLFPSVLESLFTFVIEVQIRTIPLLIVAMRDHTNDRGFSVYMRDATTPSRLMRLRSPNIKKMLTRRLNYFFPKSAHKKEPPQIVRGHLVIKMKEDELRQLCRNLLESPFCDSKTYEFLMHWCNFSIRELFHITQSILSFEGFSGFDKNLLFEKKPIFISVDDCVISMALGRHLMYFPQRSLLFNPYSVGEDGMGIDRLVASRLMQYLNARQRKVRISELKERFVIWGYSPTSIDAQIHTMVSKDVLWTDAGPPTDIRESTQVRLSYRGVYYLQNLLRRSVFNYAMSFNVNAPDESHLVMRHHKSEFRNELENFSNLNRVIDSEALTMRVIGLAQLLRDSEKQEVELLRDRNLLSEYTREVVPTSIAQLVMGGLTRLLRKVSEDPQSTLRFSVPSTATLEYITEEKKALDV